MKIEYDKDYRQFICSDFPIGPRTKLYVLILTNNRLYGAIDNVTLKEVYKKYIKSIYENQYV